MLGDKNSILVTSRIVAYGNEYNTKVTCPSCYAQVNFNFDLNNHQVRNSSDVDDLEFETTTNGTFKVTLPKTNVVAEFKVLTGADENWLARQTEKKKKEKK